MRLGAVGVARGRPSPHSEGCGFPPRCSGKALEGSEQFGLTCNSLEARGQRPKLGEKT